MIKKLIITLLIVLALTIPVFAKFKYESGNNCFGIWVDDKTGVEYIIFSTSGRGGICPRYNADGTLRVREE